MQDIELEQAVEVLLAHTQPVSETEHVPLLDAMGRVAAEDVCAGFDNPPFDRSPLDGYTFAAASTLRRRIPPRCASSARSAQVISSQGRLVRASASAS